MTQKQQKQQRLWHKSSSSSNDYGTKAAIKAATAMAQKQLK